MHFFPSNPRREEVYADNIAFYSPVPTSSLDHHRYHHHQPTSTFGKPKNGFTCYYSVPTAYTMNASTMAVKDEPLSPWFLRFLDVNQLQETTDETGSNPNNHENSIPGMISPSHQSPSTPESPASPMSPTMLPESGEGPVMAIQDASAVAAAAAAAATTTTTATTTPATTGYSQQTPDASDENNLTREETDEYDAGETGSLWAAAVGGRGEQQTPTTEESSALSLFYDQPWSSSFLLSSPAGPGSAISPNQPLQFVPSGQNLGQEADNSGFFVPTSMDGRQLQGHQHFHRLAIEQQPTSPYSWASSGSPAPAITVAPPTSISSGPPTTIECPGCAVCTGCEQPQTAPFASGVHVPPTMSSSLPVGGNMTHSYGLWPVESVMPQKVRLVPTPEVGPSSELSPAAMEDSSSKFLSLPPNAPTLQTQQLSPFASFSSLPSTPSASSMDAVGSSAPGMGRTAGLNYRTPLPDQRTVSFGQYHNGRYVQNEESGQSSGQSPVYRTRNAVRRQQEQRQRQQQQSMQAMLEEENSLFMPPNMYQQHQNYRYHEQPPWVPFSSRQQPPPMAYSSRADASAGMAYGSPLRPSAQQMQHYQHQQHQQHQQQHQQQSYFAQGPPSPMTNSRMPLPLPQPSPSAPPSTHTSDAAEAAEAMQRQLEERMLKDKFLLEQKRAGLTYKEIRRLGGFREAESTLRGRHRTLTKPKEERVRKPAWKEADDRLLHRAVRKFTRGRDLSKVKISWKAVADYIYEHGGSYHFGNTTCRKRWDYLEGLNEDENE